MNWKPLTREEIAIRLKVEPEFIPVEGNALASGDDAFDREVEGGIFRRLEQDDVWAWAMVTVNVSWGLFSASDHLGCCSYADEEDFRQPGGYFDDMVDGALEELNKLTEDASRQLKERELAA
ncbi:MAG: hypothetical protein IT365_04585 [Candidatus Hydrogenedentes bacterium]|nr:hypothetical protein [Candidatus Hydrogenedentota bacterium]